MSIFKKLFKKEKKESKSTLTKLITSQVVRETDKAVSLIFDKPTGFNFLPGQYLTLEKEIDGQTVRRAYSLCNQPSEDTLKVTVKETPDGFFSKYVNREVNPGDEFSALPPTGNFTFTAKPTEKRHIVAFAGGSGITPILSILFNLLENEPNSKFSLIYGNRVISDIIFNQTLNKAAENYTERFQLVNVLSDVTENPLSEFTGFINSEVVNKLNTDYFSFSEVDCFYLCGPGEMIQSIEDSLLQLDVEKNKIKKELFSAPIENDRSETKKDVSSSTVNLIYNGETHTLDYTDTNKTLLDLALDHGIKAPFSCMNGVCCTCSAKLEAGTVDMDQNFALEEEDVEAGYILTCQSKPTSSEITVNWDDNKM